MMGGRFRHRALAHPSTLPFFDQRWRIRNSLLTETVQELEKKMKKKSTYYKAQ